MPLRNLVIIFLAAAVSLICYSTTQRNRYASTIVEAMSIIEKDALHAVPQDELFKAAMDGMMSKLDEHSMFIGAENYSQLKEDIDQQFGGVGIVVEVNQESKRLTVLSPIVGTPAFRAGVRSGDVILEVDGVSTKGMDLKEAVKRMKGREGDPVRLTIQHAGEDQSIELTMVRENIVVDSVLGDTQNEDGTWNFVLEGHPRIGYIQLSTFGERTVSELRTALASITGDVDGLILDVRDNAGGLLTAAIDVCDLFLESGTIVTTRGRNSVVIESFSARSGTAFPQDIPMVILTNGFSASASEIVSACLQDHQRAAVIGERTWGKGTVQNIIRLQSGRSALKLTIASYWRPNGVNIHRRPGADESEEWGVKPNPGLEVKLTLEEARKVAELRRRRKMNISPTPNSPQGEDSEPSTASEDILQDPHIKKAIEYLNTAMSEAVAQRAAAVTHSDP